MFDLGFSELFLIAIVALIVLGPERLPKAARFTGLWIRRARAQWQSVKSEFENEIADEQLRNALKQTREDLREARESVVQSGQELQREFGEIDSAAKKEYTQIRAAAQGVDKPAASAASGAAAASLDAPPAAPVPAVPEPPQGDNYHLDELDDNPYPDGFPTIVKDTTGTDGQR